MAGAEEKDALRRRLRAQRKALGAQERAAMDAAICQQVVTHPAYRAAQAVYTYLSMPLEVDTYAVIRQAWADGKTVALPRCVDGSREMRWYAVTSFDGLVKSSFGVLEPDPAVAVECAPESFEAEVALVPALAFSPEGFRLGYGGGYYDTFLAGFTGYSLGLCRPGFLDGDLVPVQPHDIAVSEVLTGR